MPTTVRKLLVVVDDSAEFRAALHYACRRARATGGRVTLLRVIPPGVFEHWSGVREEIQRQQRGEAESLLQRLAVEAAALSGAPPEFCIEEGETKAAIRKVVAADPGIRLLVLAAAVGGRGPGPLVSSIAKDGVGFSGRKLPVTVVPGDLTEEEIAQLA
jgi:nucleotide-binding universal stress UspA family protein